jgi:type IV pilus assembly protein PilV
MIRAEDRHRQSGFTLIEVMIAMVVTAVGLLGLAKMQALAISGTHNAGSRSLIALQVGSLASAMHANPAFWTVVGTSGPGSFTANSNTVTGSPDLSTTSTAITSACATGCSPKEMAAYDVQKWMAGMYEQFPTYNAKVDCTVTAPITCEIYVTWSENQLAVSTAAKSSVETAVSFSAFVKP